jgi:hypothetical protein
MRVCLMFRIQPPPSISRERYSLKRDIHAANLSSVLSSAWLVFRLASLLRAPISCRRIFISRSTARADHIVYACFLDLPGIFPWEYIDKVDRLAMAAALDKGFDMLSSDATRDARARLDHASPRLEDAA